jgi:hypothetical protein
LADSFRSNHRASAWDAAEGAAKAWVEEEEAHRRAEGEALE